MVLAERVGFEDVGWRYGVQPRRVLTFGLDGKAKVAPTPPADMRVYALDDPSIQIAEADIAPGRMLFTMTCSACHGINLNSAGAPGPDLRESGIALHQGSLWPVLHEGTLLPRGMPRFAMLTPEQARQIHAYIRAGAREALGTRKASQDQASGGRL